MAEENTAKARVQEDPFKTYEITSIKGVNVRKRFRRNFPVAAVVVQYEDGQEEVYQWTSSTALAKRLARNLGKRDQVKQVETLEGDQIRFVGEDIDPTPALRVVGVHPISGVEQAKRKAPAKASEEDLPQEEPKKKPAKKAKAKKATAKKRNPAAEADAETFSTKKQASRAARALGLAGSKVKKTSDGWVVAV